MLSKLDYILSQNDHITGRYFRDEHSQIGAGTLPVFNGNNDYVNQTISASETHTFSPTWVMTASYNYLWIDRVGSAVAPLTMQSLGAQVPLANGGTSGQKIDVAITGYTTMQSNNVSIMDPHTHEGQVDVSHAVGRHLIRFGSILEHTDDFTFNHGSTEAGQWSYSAARTTSTSVKGSGDAFASFLLGLPSGFAEGSDSPYDFIMTTFALWMQDDWKITDRLTLNLGMRREPVLMPHDSLGVTAGFARECSPPWRRSLPNPWCSPETLGCRRPSCRTTGVSFRLALDSPGMFWATSKTVVRAGYGIFRPARISMASFAIWIRRRSEPPASASPIPLPC